MNEKKLQQFIRPLVRKLHPYVPGEQPKVPGLVKLNTNENPYPPAPKVLRAIQEATDQRLRLYPNPTAQGLREKLAHFHGCAPQNVFVGNGSDEVLALAVRAFVEPRGNGRKAAQETVQYFEPSYSLYPVLAETHGALVNAVSLKEDFSLPSRIELKRGEKWNFDAALTLVTTPNAPSGRGYSLPELEQLCEQQNGIVLLDEAYVDFAEENAMALAFKYPHVLVARTFSKGYSLCFLRVGYCVGHPLLIEALDKIRDSYNVNGMAQISAMATLDNLGYYRKNFRRVIATRRRVAEGLGKLGFEVLPSQTNFLLVRPPRFPASQWLEELRSRKILVRWFSHPTVRDYLRITVGTEEQMDKLLRAVRQIIR